MKLKTAKVGLWQFPKNWIVCIEITQMMSACVHACAHARTHTHTTINLPCVVKWKPIQYQNLPRGEMMSIVAPFLQNMCFVGWLPNHAAQSSASTRRPIRVSCVYTWCTS
jgi:hypothetical protein